MSGPRDDEHGGARSDWRDASVGGARRADWREMARGCGRGRGVRLGEWGLASPGRVDAWGGGWLFGGAGSLGVLAWGRVNRHLAREV